MAPFSALDLAVAVAVPVMAGTVVGGASAKADYARSAKPAWSPPAWAFYVVWPVLYALMGAASYLVWAKDASTEQAKRARRTALFLYALQLALNLAWSPVYFVLGAKWAALALLLALDVVVATTISAFARVDARAALMMAPYAAWLVVATALTTVAVVEG